METDTTTQEAAMMMAKPQEEHRWMDRFVGEWTFEGEAMMTPGAPVDKFHGTESVRSIGGLWIIAEGRAESPDGTMISVNTLGYDPRKQRYIGTLVASMMTYLWISEGTLDADKRVLTLNSVGPSMGESGEMVRSQDIIEFVDDDHRILRSRVEGEDGRWQEVMTSHYRRKK